MTISQPLTCSGKSERRDAQETGNDSTPRSGKSSLVFLLLAAAFLFMVFARDAWPKVPVVVDENGVELLRDDGAYGPPPGEYVSRSYVAELSGDPDIDALLSNYRWAGTTLTYSFYDDSEFNGEYYGSENASEVSEAVKSNYRKIFAWLEDLIEIDFVEVTEQYPSTFGKIRILAFTGSGYAHAYYPYSETLTSSAGDICLNVNYDRLGDTNGFQHDPGKHGFMTLVHELGHALGLKHPHDGSVNLPSNVDNTAHTAMSYSFMSLSAGTYMPYDIRALVYSYGSRGTFSGDTTYVFQGCIDQFKVGNDLYLPSTNCFKQAFFDDGGTDTVDFSGVGSDSGGYCIDLRGDGWLAKINECHTTYYDRGTSVGFDSLIENVISSPSDDTIIANSAANVFGGYGPLIASGIDRIEEADTNDTIDLSAFESSQLGWTRDGDDLILDLDASGQIRVVNYYVGNAPTVAFTEPVPPPPAPSGNSMMPVYRLLLIN